MPAIDVFPATIERWADIRELFMGHGPRGCWCQYWRLTSSAYSLRNNPPGGNEQRLHAQVEHGPVPGMLAYVDDQPAGWLGFWPRERLERLSRSRTIPKIDDLAVWSIVCFQVRVGYRRKGVARALLQGAIDYARQAGAPALEAYPIESGGDRVDAALGYVGFVRMFLQAGFQLVTATAARSAGRPRILMRLLLR